MKYSSRVFTEQGVYMLTTILRSKVATQVSIRIMDTFVKTRHYINYNKLLLPNKILLLEDKVDNNIKRIDELFDKFNPNDIVKDIDKKVIMISKNINRTLKDKYERQYNNVTFINSDIFHDRFIVIDRDELYHCGASFKDLGKKCFAINQINDKELFLDKLNSLIID